MATQILTIVNQALVRVGEQTISEDQFNSGSLLPHTTCREAVQEILFDMYKIKKESLWKKTFDLTTVASQAEYDLGFSGDLLANTTLWFIGTNPDPDYQLNYLSEMEARNQYIDFTDLTEEGKPTEWWFRTTDTEGQIKLRLNAIPDGIYTIRGMKYSDFSRVEGADITTCTITGDMAIQAYIAAKMAINLQKGDAEDYINRQKAYWHTWIAENPKIDEINTLVTPYQQEDIYGS